MGSRPEAKSGTRSGIRMGGQVLGLAGDQVGGQIGGQIRDQTGGQIEGQTGSQTPAAGDWADALPSRPPQRGAFALSSLVVLVFWECRGALAVPPWMPTTLLSPKAG